MPDVELALDERHRRAAFSCDGASRAGEERIELALLLLLAGRPARIRALLQDLLHVARVALRLPEADHVVELGVADERALDSSGLARVDGLIKHVTATEERVRAA